MPSHPHPSGSSGNWALLRGLRETGRRFAEGYRILPGGSLVRWVITLLVGLVLCCGLTWLITRLAQRWAAAGWLADWDRRTLLQIERSPISFQNAILAESGGNLAYLIPLTAIAAIIAARARRPILALTFIASYILARPIILLGWTIWDRPRPQLIAGGVAAPPLHSFPSGHVILALAVYGILAWLWARASRSIIERIIICILLFLWVALLGIARIRLGSHWPSDVIAGLVIGLAWLAVVIIALRRAESPSA